MLCIDGLVLQRRQRLALTRFLLNRRTQSRKLPFRVRTPEILIPEGQITAIVGDNGSGKSTLLQGIVGLLEPLSGCVRLLESQNSSWRKVHGYLGRQMRLGVVAQNTSLDAKLTVAQNLNLAGRLYGLEASNRLLRIDAMLSLAGLSEFRARDVGMLSGGQRRRIDIVRALIADPELLLLDEPASGLDQYAADLTWRHLRTHLEANDTDLRAIIFISHLEKELEFADSFILMKNGMASRLVSRQELEVQGRQDLILMGLRSGFDETLVKEFINKLRDLHQKLEDQGNCSASPVSFANESGLISLQVPNGKAIIPFIFSWPESSIIETVELKPESIIDRLTRSVLLTSSPLSHHDNGGFAH